MAKTAVFLLFLKCMFITIPNPILAEIATDVEMENVCQNWLIEIRAKTGHWSGTTDAVIAGTQDIIHEDQLLGRCFNISPRGFVIVPVLKEMSPVKLYSDECNLDFSKNEGLCSLIREVLWSRIEIYQSVYGSLEVSQSKSDQVLFSPEHRVAWGRLSVPPEKYMVDTKTEIYEEMGPLLTSSWEQRAPYNSACPMGDGDRTVVGCAATAVAQITYYWQWPPHGNGTIYYYQATGDRSCGGSTPGYYVYGDFNDEYNWTEMVDSCDIFYCSPDQAAAMAELNFEIGAAMRMYYGACGSQPSGKRIDHFLPFNFNYKPTITFEQRLNYTTEDWFQLIKNEIHNLRPIYYTIYRHAIVCDGYRDNGNGQLEYHMNYGWGGSSTAWYVLDNLYCSWVDGDICPIEWDYAYPYIEPQHHPELHILDYSIVVSNDDGDGRVDPGETANLTVSIRNDGFDGVNITGVLSSNDPHLSIINGAIPFGDILWTQSGMSLNQATLEVDNQTPDPYTAVLILNLIADGGYASTDTLLLFIGDSPGFVDMMESGPNLWMHGDLLPGYRDEWCYRQDTGYGESKGCWQYGGMDGYTNFSGGVLITPPILLTENSTLEFQSMMFSSVSFSGDGGFVMISEGNGEWIQIEPVGGYTHVIYNEFPHRTSPFEDSTYCFSGVSYWIPVSFDLSEYSGIVRFKFVFGSNFDMMNTGWFIDNIMVTNTLAGTNVIVKPQPGITLTFDQIDEQGSSGAYIGNDGPPLPAGYNSVALDSTLYYHIISTAAYSGDIEICIEYDENQVPGDESYLRLLTYNGDQWQELVHSLDTVLNIICAESSTISTIVMVTYICGDANGDETINIGDAVFLVNHVFKDTPGPIPNCLGNANGDGSVNIGDAVYLLALIFNYGPIPVSTCCP